MNSRYNALIRISLALTLATVWLSACGGSASPGATVTPKAGLANPASVFCGDKGGRVNITTDSSGGQVGICVFADGSQCEEWAFYQGKCAPGTPKATPASSSNLTEAALKNAQYELPDIKTVQLVDGKFESKVGEGATQVNRVELTRVALGDLNGDGAQDGAVILAVNTGGSGTFIYLVALVSRNGAPQQVAAELLGDRVKVQNLAVKDGQIVLDMLGFVPSDPLCCPSQSVIRTYRLQGDKLQVVSEVKPTTTP
jgi:putative hemolysin